MKRRLRVQIDVPKTTEFDITKGGCETSSFEHFGVAECLGIWLRESRSFCRLWKIAYEKVDHPTGTCEVRCDEEKVAYLESVVDPSVDMRSIIASLSHYTDRAAVAARSPAVSVEISPKAGNIRLVLHRSCGKYLCRQEISAFVRDPPSSPSSQAVVVILQQVDR